MRTFTLERDEDPTGVSGVGTVAWGVEFPDGVVALRWGGKWPCSVVFHEGVQAVEEVHGHGGATRLVFTPPGGERIGRGRAAEVGGLARYIYAMLGVRARMDIGALDHNEAEMLGRVIRQLCREEI